MTYTDIAATTRVSDLPAILNGVKTRVAPVQLLAAGAGAASAGILGGVAALEFSLTEIAGVFLPIPPRADIALGATLTLYCAPTASAASREVKFQLTATAIKAGSTVLADAATVTYASTDVAVPATAKQGFMVPIDLGSAVWAAVTAGAIVGKLTRVAIADGTEAGDVAVIGAAITYTVNR